MSTPPYRQHNYIGEFADDTTATQNCIDRGWDDGGSPRPGMVYYDITLEILKYYNGTSWVSVTGGGLAVVVGGGEPAVPDGDTLIWREATGTVWIIHGTDGTVSGNKKVEMS